LRRRATRFPFAFQKLPNGEALHLSVKSYVVALTLQPLFPRQNSRSEAMKSRRDPRANPGRRSRPPGHPWAAKPPTVLRWLFMQLSEIFQGLGEQAFGDLVRAISIGKLKIYQLYDRMKVRFHLGKLNAENMRKSTPRFWARINENDEEFATDLAQAILVSHLDMIKAVIDDLGIPNQDGFFDKDIDGAKYFTDGWSERSYEKFKDTYPPTVLLFYINHLGWELAKSEEVFHPAQVSPA
jgi:hypothetical protein